MAKGRGCNLCGYRKSADRNRTNQTTEQRRAYNTQLLDANAVVAEVKGYGFTPEVEFVNSKEPWLLRCDTCGYVSTPVIANLRKGHGCIYCSRATRGFRNDRAGSVYVVASEALGLAKVGIANGIARRIKSYTLAGWTLEARYDFPVGREARAVEQHVLRALAADGHDVGVAAPDDMPNSGHTETVPLDSLPTLLAAVESAVRTIDSPG